MRQKRYRRKPGESRLLWKVHLKRRRAIEKAVKEFRFYPCMETLSEAFRNFGDIVSLRLCGIIEDLGKAIREILEEVEG